MHIREITKKATTLNGHLIWNTGRGYDKQQRQVIVAVHYVLAGKEWVYMMDVSRGIDYLYTIDSDLQDFTKSFVMDKYDNNNSVWESEEIKVGQAYIEKVTKHTWDDISSAGVRDKVEELFPKVSN